MVRFLDVFQSSAFATGATRYQDMYAPGDMTTRIVVYITLTGHEMLPAVVDTGAPWCILNPEIIDLLAVPPELIIENERLLVRGTLYSGRLARMLIGIVAEEGNMLEVDATVFLPDLDPGSPWPHPNFIGLEGLLSRIRFAVDPVESVFYFGAI